MAIVQSFKCSNGAEICVHDDAYAEISDEEMERRKHEIIECAKKIIINAEIRKIRKKELESDQQN
ncbi:MAG: hypothetical protein J1F11_10150 [Oscillospiraceae bacterium]|nr:hypothetical protein [Oscillospiraceae bacterium]